MKKRSRKNRLIRTLEIADIDGFKILGRCPKPHKGPGLHSVSVSAERTPTGCFAPLDPLEGSAVFQYSMVPLTTVPPLSRRSLFLHV